MNLQEIFNRVRDHLLTQGEISSRTGVNCAYRGENGMSCAVGCLIPDELYLEAMEGAEVPMRTPKIPDGVSPNPTDDAKIILDQVLTKLGFLHESDERYLLGDLQLLHDCARPDTWPARFNKIAKKWDLDDQN